MNAASSAITEAVPTSVSLLPVALPDRFENDVCSACVSFSVCSQCPMEREHNALRAEVGYWRAMHKRAKEREAQLKQENQALQAKLRLRERQLFGQKSEQTQGATEQQHKDTGENRKRGQQPGAPGHGRKRHARLPATEEIVDLPEAETGCPCCGLPLAPFPGTEDSEVVEVAVQAHVRRIRRKRYKRTCSCQHLPLILSAPRPAKLMPKGAYGDSVWIEVLVDKFLFYRPTSRLLASFELLGLEMSQGTITDGLKRLAPLFEPVYKQIVLQSQQETHWHADETRWYVFAEVQGKIGYRWYLWVFKSTSAVVYILDPSRSSKVPKTHLRDVAPGAILSVDRYAAYKAVVKEKDGSLRLSWCWAHVRRDFFNLAKAWPAQEAWAMDWIEQIGTLYHQNHCRLAVVDTPSKFAPTDAVLRHTAATLKARCDDQLDDSKLHPACRKVLESLKEHWDGLTLFVDSPEIPMDNNAAERALRGPVVGRKNFYGSGAVWSGALAAVLFTLFQTLRLWEINPRVWLARFFRACAENEGHPLEDISTFLPWHMDEQELEAFRDFPKPADDTS